MDHGQAAGSDIKLMRIPSQGRSIYAPLAIAGDGDVLHAGESVGWP